MQIQSAHRHPYYIYAPPYARTSAGVKCLHLLCHALNIRGERAFFSPMFLNLGLGTHPDLLTPLLTREIADHHFAQGLQPVVLYPEIVSGNPLRADIVVRYVLNFPGLLGGDTQFPPNDLVFGYSSILAESCGVPDRVLHLPHVDTRIFNMDGVGPRSGSCFTALKYKYVHGGELFGLPEGCIEITRDQPNSQTAEEIAALFRRSEAFYCFENTSLSLEAGLCGCPTILMPNRFFNVPLAQKEHGRLGVAWGTAPEEVAHAQQTVHLVGEEYRKTEHTFEVQLARFVEITQARAASVPYDSQIHRPLLPFEIGQGFDEARAKQGRALATRPLRLAATHLFQLGRALFDRRLEARALRRTRLLDADWYLATYEDVRNAKADPLNHYLEFGAKEARDPGPFFSTRDYLLLHPELQSTGENPLVHYLKAISKDGQDH